MNDDLSGFSMLELFGWKVKPSRNSICRSPTIEEQRQSAETIESLMQQLIPLKVLLALWASMPLSSCSRT